MGAWNTSRFHCVGCVQQVHTILKSVVTISHSWQTFLSLHFASMLFSSFTFACLTPLFAKISVTGPEMYWISHYPVVQQYHRQKISCVHGYTNITFLLLNLGDKGSSSTNGKLQAPDSGTTVWMSAPGLKVKESLLLS